MHWILSPRLLFFSVLPSWASSTWRLSCILETVLCGVLQWGLMCHLTSLLRAASFPPLVPWFVRSFLPFFSFLSLFLSDLFLYFRERQSGGERQREKRETQADSGLSLKPRVRGSTDCTTQASPPISGSLNLKHKSEFINLPTRKSGR